MIAAAHRLAAEIATAEQRVRDMRVQLGTLAECFVNPSQLMRHLTQAEERLQQAANWAVVKEDGTA